MAIRHNFKGSTFYFCLCVYLFVCVLMYLCVLYVFVYLCLFMCLFMCLFVYVFVCWFLCLFVCFVFVYLCCLFMCLLFCCCLCVCLLLSMCLFCCRLCVCFMTALLLPPAEGLQVLLVLVPVVVLLILVLQKTGDFTGLRGDQYSSGLLLEAGVPPLVLEYQSIIYIITLLFYMQTLDRSAGSRCPLKVSDRSTRSGSGV